ncbi:hypothetical protein ACMFWY_06405 [Roseiconus sp. JC912]|uniref:hypothetical protein n=1 Tax=Roseiconus sp. JC912 TaxID=3396307 RepID=UPI003A4C83A3
MAAPIEIIDRTDSRDLATLQKAYPHKNRADACAWVQIKSLYVSVTPTRASSWPKLLEKRSGSSQRVVIYTGRHGGQTGSTTAADVLYERVKEQKFVAEDVTTAISTLATSSVLFSVRDAGKAPFTDILKLRQHILNDVAAGHLVILAWCYSLLAMFEMPVQTPLIAKYSWADHYKGMSIAELSRDGFRELVE